MGESVVPTDLATWLLACVDEDALLAQACIDEVGSVRKGEPYDDGSGDADRDDFPSYPWGSEQRELDYMAGPGHPSRVLAECDTKRRIIELHVSAGKLSTGDDDLPGSWHDYCKTCGSGEPYEYPTYWPCETLRLLALLYRDRDGYRPEWAPDGGVNDLPVGSRPGTKPGGPVGPLPEPDDPEWTEEA